VTVSQLEREGGRVNLLAKVCVKKLRRTHKATEPGSVGTPGPFRSTRARCGRTHQVPPPVTCCPPTRPTGVEDCATGWIPFATRASPSKIKYSNGLGDTAVWDARNLDANPKTGHTVATPSTTKAPSHDEDVYYQDCDAVREAGRAPIHRGDPGYGSQLDSDGDGVV
jgi:hypothetical protein